ncbi:MAG: hypothetical protein K2P51_07200 [Rhabdochlamydiaceae bacterium]|nr:hypothetical protein [Rhabdochlamydiaceae bacterium]
MLKFLISKFWVILGCVVGAISLWIVGAALFALSNYWKLSTPVPAQVTQWKVVEISSSSFAVEALYTYEFKKKNYSGSTLFDAPLYLNPYAAASDLKKWEALTWQAWIQPSHPEISSLQRHFPSKKIVHAVLTLGVVVYFLFLRRWLLSRS